MLLKSLCSHTPFSVNVSSFHTCRADEIKELLTEKQTDYLVKCLYNTDTLHSFKSIIFNENNMHFVQFLTYSMCDLFSKLYEVLIYKG